MESTGGSCDGSNCILVAVDGSDAAHAAFEVVTQSLLQPNDNLLVAHVFNNDKTYLPFNMHADNIKATYESLISGYGHRAKLLWEHLDPRMTTKEHVI